METTHTETIRKPVHSRGTLAVIATNHKDKLEVKN
jgi:hypothetical protein